MLKRPSSRRKSSQNAITLNLVPILDTMVALIGFLLFTMSFFSIVSIESPFPQTSRAVNQEKLQEKPLQLTLSFHPDGAELWSPFERVPTKEIPNTAEGKPDTQAIHAALIEIKQKFPRETQLVLVPSGGMSYDMLISVMDSVRAIEPTDPPIFVHDEKLGVDQSLKTLFPEVVFGNLLGDA
jgi:biopolymer transport protein ExbD